MKKNRFFTCSKICTLAIIGASALFFASCAKDGFTEETFVSSVTNSTLSSPELTKANFGTQMNSDGSESVVVTWKVVPGAGGYAYEVYNVDDPANPVELVKGVTDSPTFTFPKAEDTRYQVKVRTLGNLELNNTEAPEATVFAYSTMIDAKIIPNGSDIAEFIAANLTASEDEQAFELEAGGSYTCNAPVDFMDNKMTLRGDKITHPIVTFGESGIIYTSAMLKVKWINFDCTAMTSKWGVIEMSPNPPASRSAVSQGIGAGKNNGNPADVYILPETEPIMIQDCAFKNVPNCFIAAGECAWGIGDIRILNSVIQLNCDGSKNSNASFLSAYSAGYKNPSGSDNTYNGCIKNLTIKESTIFNTVLNTKNYFIRFNNKDIDRIFPTADGTCTMMDNTISRVFSGKNWADRTPNQPKYVITYDNNIFFECFRLQKFFQNNCTFAFHQEQNVGFYAEGDGTIDGTDKSKWLTEEDPGFAIDNITKELDFTQPNYGLNFKATGAISSNIGDPRWRQ